MLYLQKPRKGVWLAAQPHLNRYRLEEQIKQAEVCLSDLDETDCASPAKAIALNQWHQRFWTDKTYRGWLLGAVNRTIKEGKRGDSASWKQYVETFLNTPEARAAVQARMTPDFILNSFYPQVQELYGIIPAHKVYVSRNIKEVVEPIVSLFGFAGGFHDIYDKKHFAAWFVGQHPQFQRYLVRGDSEEDQQMLDGLRSCQRNLKIQSVLGIYCAEKPLQEKHTFEVETSRDHSALVNILKE